MTYVPKIWGLYAVSEGMEDPKRQELQFRVKTYLKYAFWAVAIVAVFAMLWPRAATSPQEAKAIKEGRVIITYWDRSQGHEYEMHNKIIDEFNHSQNHIYVRTLSIGWQIEKLLTAISSGAPPDVCSMENTTIASLGYQGCFMDLTDWMKSIPALHPDRFFKHTMDLVTIKGHIYGIPCMTDDYCLLWNKALFRKAGLDPDRPPKNIKELEQYAAKLTVVDNGDLQTVGFLPWLPWDMTHMWGVLFGGRWYDRKTGWIVCAMTR